MRLTHILTKALPMGWFTVGWFLRVTADRTITLPELVELTAGLVDILEIPVTIEVPQDLIDAVGGDGGRHVRLVAVRGK